MDMIVAHANNRAIGKGNRLPWRVPADMDFFVRQTKQSKNLLVGRKTLMSIPKQKLPERNIYVLSTQHSPIHEESVLSRIENVLALDKKTPLLIIGGQSIYEAFLPYIERLFITRLSLDIDGADTFFPEYENTFSLNQNIESGKSNNIDYSVDIWTPNHS
jgi:dihydrofolate reductase